MVHCVNSTVITMGGCTEWHCKFHGDETSTHLSTSSMSFTEEALGSSALMAMTFQSSSPSSIMARTPNGFTCILHAIPWATHSILHIAYICFSASYSSEQVARMLWSKLRFGTRRLALATAVAWGRSVYILKPVLQRKPRLVYLFSPKLKYLHASAVNRLRSCKERWLDTSDDWQSTGTRTSNG